MRKDCQAGVAVFYDLIPGVSSGYDPQSMAQTFFKVLAPQEALKILLSVEPVGKEQIASVKARARVLAEDLHSAVDSAAFSSRGDGRLCGQSQGHFRRQSKFAGLFEACRRRGNGQGGGASVNARVGDAHFHRRHDAARRRCGGDGRVHRRDRCRLGRDSSRRVAVAKRDPDRRRHQKRRTRSFHADGGCARTISAL